MNEKHMNTSQYKKKYIYQRESVYKMTPKKRKQDQMVIQLGKNKKEKENIKS